MLTERGALAGGGRGEAEAGTIGIEHETVPDLDTAARIELHPRVQLFGRLPGAIEPGAVSGDVLLSQLALVATRDEQRLARLEVAVDAQASQQGGALGCACAPGLEDVSGVSQAMVPRHVTKRRAR